jgi:hypothetical protein
LLFKVIHVILVAFLPRVRLDVAELIKVVKADLFKTIDFLQGVIDSGSFFVKDVLKCKFSPLYLRVALDNF